MSDLYCKLYIDTDSDGFENQLQRLTRGRLELRTIATLALEISVCRNKGPDITAATDDFVLWPCMLEIEPAGPNSQDLDQFIEALAELMQILSAQGRRVVASCDFEEELEAKLRLR